MKKIKIAYIIPTLSLGGAEKQQIAIFNSLDRERFDPRLFVLKNALALLPQVNNKDEVLSYESKGMISLFFSGIIGDLKEFQPDIIHSQMYNANLFVRFVSILIPGTKVINHIHGLSRWMRGYHVLIERIFSFLSDKFIVTGKKSKDLRVKREGYPESKIIVLPSSVEINKFKGIKPIKKDVINIGTVSRLIKLKRIDKVISFTKWCVDRGVDICLHIAGDGPEKENLVNLVNESSLVDHTHFYGFVDETEEFYSLIDVLFVTSDTEDFPLSIVEALASGKPVVSTPVGNIPNVLKDTCSKLTEMESKDYVSVLSFINEIDDNNCKKINQLKAGEYSHEKYMKKLSEIYWSFVNK